MGQAGSPAFMGAEISPWGWKFHARLILGGQQAVPIVQGQILKAMRGGFQLGRLRAHNPCTIVPDRPHSLERAGSTRYSPTDHQPDSGKPLSVKCSLMFH